MKSAYITLSIGATIFLVSLVSLLWLNVPTIFIGEYDRYVRNTVELHFSEKPNPSCKIDITPTIPSLSVPLMLRMKIKKGSCASFRVSGKNLVSVEEPYHELKVKDKPVVIFDENKLMKNDNDFILLNLRYKDATVQNISYSENQVIFSINTYDHEGINVLPPVNYSGTRRLKLSGFVKNRKDNLSSSFHAITIKYDRSKEEQNTLNIIIAAILGIGIAAFFEGFLALSILKALKSKDV